MKTSKTSKTAMQDPPGSRSGTLSLGINTKFVEVGVKTASGAVSEPGRDNTCGAAENLNLGLLRVKWGPRGVDVEKLENDDLRVYRRALRWQRLRAVQWALHGQRVEKCYRVRIAPHVEVWRSPEHKRAHYKNLMVCGSVWACPVCAAKISERRKIELSTAPRLDRFSRFMVTYTLQHNRWDRLQALHADLVAGIRDMKMSWGYKNLVKDLQIVGTVRGLEITISNVNGWHPHVHELGFSTVAQDDINAEELRRELSRLFVLAMQKRGRYVHDEIGVNVRTDNVLAEYVAKMGEGEKWGVVAEITKSPVKTGRGDDHFHPFELLDMVLAKNKDAARLFIEYAMSLKGKRQLSYSKGLRALLGMDQEITDQEIAERIDDDAGLFAMIEPQHWRKIIQHERRAEVLEVASTGNYVAFVAWMRAIGCKDFGR